MNILDVIKDCILRPFYLKDYDLEEQTVDTYSATQTFTNESAFSGFSSFSKIKENPKLPSIDDRLLRMYMRIWNGLTKIIAKTVAKGSCFVTLNIGYFFPLRGLDATFAYSPNSEFMERYGLTVYEDAYTIHPNKRFVCYI